MTHAASQINARTTTRTTVFEIATPSTLPWKSVWGLDGLSGSVRCIFATPLLTKEGWQSLWADGVVLLFPHPLTMPFTFPDRVDNKTVPQLTSDPTQYSR